MESGGEYTSQHLEAVSTDKDRVISTALKGLLVIDEAYIDFAPDPERSSAMTMMEEFPHLVILQTLSKSHGLAGMRYVRYTRK